MEHFKLAYRYVVRSTRYWLTLYKHLSNRVFRELFALLSMLGVATKGMVRAVGLEPTRR